MIASVLSNILVSSNFYPSIFIEFEFEYNLKKGGGAFYIINVKLHALLIHVSLNFSIKNDCNSYIVIII